MNPVAAGGVVAYLVTDTETGMTRVNEYKTIEGAARMKQEELVRASDLEACQKHCQSLEQRIIDCVAQIERDTQYLAAAQAELAHWKDCNLYPSTYREAVEKLRAAQAEADRLRVDALSEVMNIACRELPEGYEVRLCAERGAGWVALFDHDGDEVEFDQDDLTLPERVRASIKAAKNEQGSGNV